MRIFVQNRVEDPCLLSGHAKKYPLQMIVPAYGAGRPSMRLVRLRQIRQKIRLWMERVDHLLYLYVNYYL